jgi:Uma2 family endonuclease
MGDTIVVSGELDEDILLHIPPDAHTLKGFRKWVLSDACPEKMPVMFLNGRIHIDMSKEEILTHASVKTEVAGVLWELNREIDVGELFINGVLVTNEEADVSNNPDMVAVFWETLEKGLVEYIRRGNRELEIVGSPDWLLEIVSRSSVTKDKRELRRAYHKAKVREYWIIDARREEISFAILHWRKSGYAAAPVNDGWMRSRVFGREFRLTRTRNRRGAWKYTLDVR